MSYDERAWNERGIARSTHGEWPSKNAHVKTLRIPSPDQSSFSESPTRATSWPAKRSPDDISPAYFPQQTRPRSTSRSNSHRSARGDEHKRPAPPGHRDSVDSTRSASRPRSRFFRDYEECKMRTLEAERAEETYNNMVKAASKLSRKDIKERQGNPRVFSGTPLATRDWHEKAAELAETAADAFHDAIKGHRRMVEHYRHRGDKEKQDWHKSIIDKFGSKENLMNSHYSQHITSHTDPSTIRGYVNARRESLTVPMADMNTRAVKTVDFDLHPQQIPHVVPSRTRSRAATHPVLHQERWLPPHRRNRYMAPITMPYSTSESSLSSDDDDLETDIEVDSDYEAGSPVERLSKPVIVEPKMSEGQKVPEMMETTKTPILLSAGHKPLRKTISIPSTVSSPATSPRAIHTRDDTSVSEDSTNTPHAPAHAHTATPLHSPKPRKEHRRNPPSPLIIVPPIPISSEATRPAHRDAEAKPTTPPAQTRRARTLTREGSTHRSTTPKLRKSFYDEWDRTRGAKNVKRIGETGRGPMGRQAAQAFLPWTMLVMSFIM